MRLTAVLKKHLDKIYILNFERHTYAESVSEC
jgi:hypothetical protein